MNALRRPGVRFVAEAAVIVLTAVDHRLSSISALWGSAAPSPSSGSIVAVIEYSLSHPRERAEPAPLVETLPVQAPVSSEAVRVIRPSDPPPR